MALIMPRLEWKPVEKVTIRVLAQELCKFVLQLQMQLECAVFEKPGTG